MVVSYIYRHQGALRHRVDVTSLSQGRASQERSNRPRWGLRHGLWVQSVCAVPVGKWAQLGFICRHDAAGSPLCLHWRHF